MKETGAKPSSRQALQSGLAWPSRGRKGAERGAPQRRGSPRKFGVTHSWQLPKCQRAVARRPRVLLAGRCGGDALQIRIESQRGCLLAEPRPVDLDVGEHLLHVFARLLE